MARNLNLYRIINEELTKNEVASLINSKIDSNLDSKEFEKRVKEISASVIEELFKTLYQRDSLWKSAIKR
jgi:hypothetical protein